MKNINKFSKLAVLFTALYYLVTMSISTSLLKIVYSINWTHNIHIGSLRILGILILVCMVTSIIFGILSIIKVFKKGGMERFLIIILTLWNILMFYFLLLWWIG